MSRHAVLGKTKESTTVPSYRHSIPQAPGTIETKTKGQYLRNCPNVERTQLWKSLHTARLYTIKSSNARVDLTLRNVMEHTTVAQVIITSCIVH